MGEQWHDDYKGSASMKVPCEGAETRKSSERQRDLKPILISL